MSRLDEIAEPTDAELWAIELEIEASEAERALLGAKVALLLRPTNGGAVRYLRTLLDVVDLRELTGTALVQHAAGIVR